MGLSFDSGGSEVAGSSPGAASGREPGRRSLLDAVPPRQLKSDGAASGGVSLPDGLAGAGRGAAGGGSPLPADTRTQMEGAFGVDFSSVRTHVGPEAADAGALAYTEGRDIHFQPGHYDPHSRSGKQLIGHELAHVVQQSDGRVAPTHQHFGGGLNQDPGLEAEADARGNAAAEGHVASGPLRSLGSGGGTRQRKVGMLAPDVGDAQRQIVGSMGKPEAKPLATSDVPQILEGAPPELRAELTDLTDQLVQLMASPHEWFWLNPKPTTEDHKGTGPSAADRWKSSYQALLTRVQSLKGGNPGTKISEAQLAKNATESRAEDSWDPRQVFHQPASFSGDRYGVLAAMLLDDKLRLRILWDRVYTRKMYQEAADNEKIGIYEYFKRTDKGDQAAADREFDTRLMRSAMELASFYTASGVAPGRIRIEHVPSIEEAYYTPPGKNLPSIKAVSKAVEEDQKADADPLTAPLNAVKRGTYTVASAFKADPEGARAKLKEKWITDLAPDKKAPVDAFLEAHPDLARGPNVLLWMRNSGTKPDAVHSELDTHKSIVMDVLRVLKEMGGGFKVWCVGDKIWKFLEPHGRKKADKRMFKKNKDHELEDYDAKSDEDQFTDMQTFWNSNWLGTNLKESNLDRGQQLYLMSRLAQNSVSLGTRSGILESGALIGMPTIYIDYEASPGSERMQTWSGRERQIRKDKGSGTLPKQDGPIDNYKVLLLENDDGTRQRALMKSVFLRQRLKIIRHAVKTHAREGKHDNDPTAMHTLRAAQLAAQAAALKVRVTHEGQKFETENADDFLAAVRAHETATKIAARAPEDAKGVGTLSSLGGKERWPEVFDIGKWAAEIDKIVAAYEEHLHGSEEDELRRLIEKALPKQEGPSASFLFIAAAAAIFLIKAMQQKKG